MLVALRANASGTCSCRGFQLQQEHADMRVLRMGAENEGIAALDIVASLPHMTRETASLTIDIMFH